MKTFALLFLVSIAFAVFGIIYAQGGLDPEIWKDAVAFFNVLESIIASVDKIIIDGIVLINKGLAQWIVANKQEFAENYATQFLDGSEQAVASVIEFIDNEIAPALP